MSAGRGQESGEWTAPKKNNNPGGDNESTGHQVLERRAVRADKKEKTR